MAGNEQQGREAPSPRLENGGGEEDFGPALEQASSHHKAGRFAEAEALYGKILDARPDAPGILSKLGAALAAQGKFDAARQALDRAIRLDPVVAEAHSNLGGVLQIQGNLEAAVQSFRRALDIDPGLAAAHVNLGNILLKQGEAEAAAAAYRKTLDINPDFAQAHNGLGAAMLAQGQLEEAETAFRRALELDPDHAETHNNLGNLLRAQGKFDQAVESFGHALARRPDLVEAHTNLGNALKSRGDMDNAVESFRRALDIDPENAETHWNLAQVLLLQGRLREGWSEYEWRTKCGDFRSMIWNVDGPKWDGGDLDGKTILLYAEQGLGDTLQFIRYARGIAQKGGEVVVKCLPALSALIQTAPGVARVVSRIDRSVPYEVQASLASLPHILGTEEETTPADVPYLTADQDRVETWRRHLGDTGFRVGINWQGSPSYKADWNRSMALRFFEPLAKVPGVRLISLQKKNGLEQLEDLPEGMSVETLGDDFDEGPDAFIDTAAVMMSLDLIISSDTSIAHLAGALAQPVWTLLPFVPDWRWMLERGDTPWYPTMRLFRQQTHGDWPGVFSRVENALLQRIGS
jgi:type IV pilus biogenesis/stability protein PilW